MTTPTELPVDPFSGSHSDAVIAHLNIVQGVISRMARNSTICKTWCVTLVAAILVLVARTDTPIYALIALVPTVLFLFLDSFYLGLERGFRRSYNSFVEELHNGEIAPRDLYVVKRTKLDCKQQLDLLRSSSIWPFYTALVIAIGVMTGLAILCACTKVC